MRSRAVRSGRALGVALTLVALAQGGRAEAIVLAEDPFEETSTELALMIRSFSFVFASPILRPPYNTEDANPSGAGLADLRLTFAHQSKRWQLVAAGQLTPRVQSDGLGGRNIGRGVPPPRWLPLRGWITRRDHVQVLAGFDWLYLRTSLGPVTITAGRQPVSFGRGQLWHPTDMVSMFSLTEVDTEYKPGADALRVDWQIAERSSLVLLAVAGELADGHDLGLSLAGSSFLARFKQGIGKAEVALMAGLSRRDVVVAVDGIVDLGFGDLYGEAVLNVPTSGSLTPNPDARCAFTRLGVACADGSPPVVVRAVVGLRLKPTKTLTTSLELFYNGFGSFDREDYLAVASSERVAIGEVVALGALCGGASLLWELHPLFKLSAALLANLRDPSALLFSGLVYSAAANVDLIAGVYLPIARVPDISQAPLVMPRSEYGLYPTFFFLELKIAV
ncbi:MAG: hypothetical protein CSA65_08540 [Proteobacteria bacterium]|nr:MAG: hypothetical protein CSA65_08540 [Pseudomonadota bacterium]